MNFRYLTFFAKYAPIKKNGSVNREMSKQAVSHQTVQKTYIPLNSAKPFL